MLRATKIKQLRIPNSSSISHPYHKSLLLMFSFLLCNIIPKQTSNCHRTTQNTIHILTQTLFVLPRHRFQIQIGTCQSGKDKKVEGSVEKRRGSTHLQGGDFKINMRLLLLVFASVQAAGFISSLPFLCFYLCNILPLLRFALQSTPPCPKRSSPAPPMTIPSPPERHSWISESW